jgi:hypothetical protein
MRIPFTVQLIGGAIALGGAYELAVKGMLGPTLQGLAEGIPVTPPPSPSNPNPQPNGPTILSGLQLPGPYGDPTVMTAANPSFLSLVSQWKVGSLAANAGNLPGPGTPFDWPSFRLTLTRLGYPDVGPNPTVDFARA